MVTKRENIFGTEKMQNALRESYTFLGANQKEKNHRSFVLASQRKEKQGSRVLKKTANVAKMLGKKSLPAIHFPNSVTVGRVNIIVAMDSLLIQPKPPIQSFCNPAFI